MRWRSALLAAVAASALVVAAVLAGGPEQVAIGEPRTAADVLRVLLEHEAVRGMTFGAAGVLIAVALGLVHVVLEKVPDAVYPPPFIAPIVNFGAVAAGVLLATHPLIDLSHGVHMGVEAIALYNLAHYTTRKPGGRSDFSQVINPRGT